MTKKDKDPNAVEQSYDAMPYTHFSYPQTHPTHLYTLGKLFGLTPEPVENARILELGCGTGGNIIPMACHFKNAQLLGIDLSSVQISAAIQQKNDLALNNLTLKHQSFAEFTQTEKKSEFDYIICHGVYAWVEAEVQNHILTICKNHLKPNGMACISYNTYPGWHLLQGIRQLMLWYTKDIQDPQIKVKKARNILNYVRAGLTDNDSPIQKIYHQEISKILFNTDNYLFHEQLEKVNNPLYLYQFIDEIEKHQLTYLCDAFLVHHFIDILPQEYATKLREIEDLTVVSQLIDFLYNQRFHHSVITHQGVHITRNVPPKKIREFYFKYHCETDKPDFSLQDIGKLPLIYFKNDACSLPVKNPVAQHFMLLLMQNRDKFIHYDELCQQLALAGPIHDVEDLKLFIDDELNLLSMAFAGLIEISAYPGDYTLDITDKPLACPLARYLAKRQFFITNRNHTCIKLDPVSKVLLPYLDGKNDLTSLVHLARLLLPLETLGLLDENNRPIGDEQIIPARVRDLCLKSLTFLAKNAALIG